MNPLARESRDRSDAGPVPAALASAAPQARSRHAGTRRRILAAALGGALAGWGATVRAQSGGSRTGSAEAGAGGGEARTGSEARPGGLLYGKPLPLPPKGQWRFDIYFGEYRSGFRVASLDYTIYHDGRHYTLRSAGRAEGLTALVYSGVLTQSSAGLLSANGLQPEHYTEKRGKRPTRTVDVDYATGRVVFGDNAPVPIVAGAQDRLSVLVQLGLMARAMPERFARGAVVPIPEMSTSKTETSTYAVHGEARLETGSGALRALHLERTAPKKADDNRIEVWLGYDLDLLPVRIRVTDPGGRVLDQMLAR